jgi:uracil-DNA glycosylase
VRDEALRTAYLDALGIDRWVAKRAELLREPGILPEAGVLPEAAPPRVARARPAPEPLARDPIAPEPPRPGPVPIPPGLGWTGLREHIAGCMACDLCKTRTQTVFGVGNERADWLIIGEAPGAEEDRRGEPFVGRAGQLLDAMLLAIGLPRETVFIANVLKCRPPGNRDPKPEEVSRCLPFLSAQVALLKPKVILVVGRIAAQALLATDLPLARLRGKLHTFGDTGTPLVITYHPAYLLRAPADKRKAWEDLKFARATYAKVSAERAAAEPA